MTTQHSLLSEASTDELRDVLDADADLPESQRRWAPMLANLLRVVEATQRRRGLSEAAAFASAAETVTAIAEYFGGRPVYIPRGDKLKQSLRDAEIYRRENGRNQAELASEFGLTTVTIYAILREQRALHVGKLQGRLFDEPSTEEKQ